MGDSLSAVTAQLSDSPWLQGILIALGTFILEDPTTVTSGLLVADGRLAFPTALVGLTLGIALGDFGLYLIGRLMGPKAVAWGLVSEDRMQRAKSWFDRNLIMAVLVSRFLPGMRLPTYVGAGLLHAPALRFFLVALAASLLWTVILLSAVTRLGEAVLPLLGAWKWPVALVFIVGLILLQRRSGRRLAEPAETGDAAPEPVVSAFELWPPALFYIPVGFYYAWLALRYRSFTLPTLANPHIYSGGMVGESKSEILDMVPPELRWWLAPHVRLTRSRPDVGPRDEAVEAEETMRAADLVYPVVAKPDIGQRGAGVQIVRRRQELEAYLGDCPHEAAIMLQQLVDEAHEAGVMYVRHPESDRPELFSITLKSFPAVTGDGRHSLRELIEAEPRARLIRSVYFERHAKHLERVLGSGENFPLVFAGNHAQGAIFRDGTHLATEALLARIHAIAVGMPEFYFGRFDVRFSDLDRFLAGEDFTVIEINGAGAEATHIWDANMRLADAYGTLYRQFRVLFEIGAYHRAHGHRALGAVRFVRDFWAYQRLAKGYPRTH